MRAYLSGGSNLGDRRAHLASAVLQLGRDGTRVVRISSIYETEPVGFPNQPWFLNIALAVETVMDPRNLLVCCHRIEELQGRKRSFPGAPRPLDLDILLFGQRIVDDPDLRIPHPRMAERRFVLEPLAEIAPDVRHPELKRTILSLAASVRDPASVRRLCAWGAPPATGSGPD